MRYTLASLRSEWLRAICDAPSEKTFEAILSRVKTPALIADEEGMLLPSLGIVWDS